MTNTQRGHGGMKGNGPEPGPGTQEFQEMQIGSNSEDLESFSMTEVFYYTNWRRYYGKICKWSLWNSLYLTELNIIHICIQTMEKLSNERKKSKRPFLYRVWKFLQVTATEVIKGDSELDISQIEQLKTNKHITQSQLILTWSCHRDTDQQQLREGSILLSSITSWTRPFWVWRKLGPLRADCSGSLRAKLSFKGCVGGGGWYRN